MTAQDQKQLPGNPTLPNSSEELAALKLLETGTYDYSVRDYFQKPAKYAFQFSPDGKYLSYRERDDNGKAHLYVQNTETDTVERILTEGDELIRGYGWANNARLIYVMDAGGDENYHIYAIDIDGRNNQDLTPFDGVRANIQNILRDQPDYIIVLMNKENPQIFEPFKLNIVTGDLDKLMENTDPLNPISGYTFDKDGELRAYAKQVGGTNYILYYKQDDGTFSEVVKTMWKDSFGIVGFDYAGDNRHVAFVKSNLDNDTEALLKYDFATNEVVEQVYADDTYDMGGVARSRKRGYEVDYYYYTGAKSHIIPVSDTYKALHARFAGEFGDLTFSIASTTEAEDKYLLYVTSDRLYGTYYMYDAVDDTCKKLVDLMPQLRAEDMAEMRPIHFQSRDGLTLHAYLTIPPGLADGDRAPMIVNPHGGPYGPRDTWGFNPEAQLFASRGYATLQINYRGSGGYGKTFFLAGSKQIGRKMLDDLEDGVDYAIGLGMIDADRVGIYGASYGGLATLGSLVKTPDLYQCGVDYVGVSNLFTFFKSFPPYWKPYLTQVYEQWYDENDPADIEIMKAVSPALNVDKITKPLYIVQGANDPRVNIDESDQVVQNLRARGVDVPYMVKYNEGHGFGHEDNRIELYETMVGFFAKHLKGV
jgi:dipeptidyl aminopeptidase/acylaminoacyl peptidase